MSTEAPELQTLADRAYDSIFALIMSGELAPGTVITELDIARRFAISRGPVREAFRRLEGRKLIVREAFQRPRVASLGPQEIREIFEVREGLEAIACRLATLRMSDAELDRLAQNLEKSRTSRRPGTFDLHEEIARGCANERIRELLCGDLNSLMQLYRRRSGARAQRGAEAYQEHWQIVRAMLTRDADLAESLMRSHIRRATENLAEIAGENAEPTVAAARITRARNRNLETAR